MRRRLLVQCVAVALLASSLGLATASPASAITPYGTLVEIGWEVDLSGPSEACKDTDVSFRVSITKLAGYDNGHNVVFYPWGTVAGVVTLEAAGATRSVAVGPGGDTVPMRFPSSGTFTVTASGSNVLANPPLGSVMASVDPASTRIKVIDCDFEIQQMSIWFHLREGFKPWVGGLVPPGRLHLEPGGAGMVYRGSLETFAIGDFENCTVTYEVEDVSAFFRAELTNAETLHYLVVYTPGTATTKVLCPTPLNPIGGDSRQDRFDIDTISDTVTVGPVCVLACLWSMTPVRVSIKQPHVLHEASDANGLTYIIVEQK